jgi:predicted RNase H-like HicB family nuclease
VNYIKRLIAFVLSFRKRDWAVRDYPIQYRRQNAKPTRVRGELAYPKPWVAQIPGWWSMFGLGDTREEALLELQKSLEAYRESEGTLPRPGTGVPIRFGPFVFMSRNEDLAREFFPPILGVSYDDCLITDSSSVWDFPVELSAEDLVRKVLLVFGSDISDLAEDGNIAAILDRIAANRRGA